MTQSAAKIGFVVNDIATEQDNYTTIRLARKAVARGHEVAFIGLGDFIYDWQDGICAMATISKIEKFEDDGAYLGHLQDKGMERTRIRLPDYDILMLRADLPQNWLRGTGRRHPVCFLPNSLLCTTRLSSTTPGT